MRTRWNPDKQIFEAFRSRRKAVNSSPLRSPKKQLCVRISDDLMIALKSHYDCTCESIGYKVTFNEYIVKLLEAHLQSLGLEPLEAHDCSN